MTNKPMDFFKEAEQNFKSLAENGRLSHSYIFFGESENEMLVFAKELANFLETGEFKETKKFLQDLSVIIENEKGNIGIDEARALKSFLYSRPAVSKRKTAVISGFENLTGEAQSAILKIVEEPPKQSLIILVGKNPDNLFATIASRFQKIYFPSNGIKAEKKARRQQGSGLQPQASEQKTKPAYRQAGGEDQLEKLNELIAKLKKDPKKNLAVLKEALNRLSLMKRFNLNKKLQVRLVEGLLKNSKK